MANKDDSKSLCAFTLAEVLITLGIIGIVASMTIPTLMNASQKQQNVTALKKFYSTFNNALTQYAADEGCVGDLKCTTFKIQSNNAQTVALATALTTAYIKIAKNCGQLGDDSAANSCFSPKQKTMAGQTLGEGFGVNYNKLNGCGQPYYKFVTADGMSVGMGICGDIVVVDVNGAKLPNTEGRDIFSFEYSQTGAKIIPTGVATDCGGPSSRNACVTKIIEDGWQMNY